MNSVDDRGLLEVCQVLSVREKNEARQTNPKAIDGQVGRTLPFARSTTSGMATVRSAAYGARRRGERLLAEAVLPPALV
jgi:hypothetical protein